MQRNLRRAIQRFIDWAKEPDIPPGMDSPEPNDAYMEDDNDDEEGSSSDDEQEEAVGVVDEAFRAEVQAALGKMLFHVHFVQSG